MQPFYTKVSCTKLRKDLWNARLTDGSRSHCVGAGNTAENAIRDLAKQLRKVHVEDLVEDLRLCDNVHSPLVMRDGLIASGRRRIEEIKRFISQE